MHRRQFLTAAGASLLATGFMGSKDVWASYADSPVGVMLFTVMFPLEKDFEGTLKAVRKIGYRNVETVGSMGRDPAFLRQMLDQAGLTTSSQHLAPLDIYTTFNELFAKKISFEQLKERYLSQFNRKNVVPLIENGIATAKTLGQKYIVWPILFDVQINSLAAVQEICETFNIAGDLCAKEGLIFCFHNHAIEFEPIGNDVPYDILLKNTNPDTVKFQLDAYWTTKAKADPLAYFANYPNRYRLCHLKDIDSEGNFADVGTGIIDIPAFFKAAQKAGIERFYVERDDAPEPLVNIEISYKNVRKMNLI